MKLKTLIAAGYLGTVSMVVVVGLVGWKSLDDYARTVAQSENAARAVEALADLRTVETRLGRAEAITDQDLATLVGAATRGASGLGDKGSTSVLAYTKALGDYVTAKRTLVGQIAAIGEDVRGLAQKADQAVSSQHLAARQAERDLDSAAAARDAGKPGASKAAELDQEFLAAVGRFREGSSAATNGRKVKIAALDIAMASEQIASGRRAFLLDEIKGKLGAVEASMDEVARITGASAADMKALSERLTRGFDKLIDARSAADNLETTMTHAAEQAVKVARAISADNLAAAHASQERVTNVILATIALASLLGIALATVIGRRVSRGIERMSGAMTQVAAGDLTVAVPFDGQRDELGLMAAALTEFKKNAALREEAEERAAAERQRAEAERKRVLDELAAACERQLLPVAAAVSRAADDQRAEARRLAESAERTGVMAATVTEEAGTTSASISAVAEAAQEMTAASAEISRTVANATDLTSTSRADAAQARSGLGDLRAATQSVSSVIEMIRGVAKQTNLLALNATIEAARAGEHGKGFAVVASEVKSLARQAGSATDEVDTRIQAILVEAERAAAALQGIVDAVESIDQAATSISTAVEQQHTSTAEIAETAQSVAVSAERIGAAIAEVSAAAMSAGRGATQIGEAAERLQDQAAHMERTVKDFIVTVRAF